MFKGTLMPGMRFFRRYHGSAHTCPFWRIRPGQNFTLAVNSASDISTRQNDVNDLIDDALTVDRTRESQDYPSKLSGCAIETRKAWKPSSTGPITVYGLGFLFEPERNGMQEWHMNQGNPPTHDRNAELFCTTIDHTNLRERAGRHYAPRRSMP